MQTVTTIGLDTSSARCDRAPEVRATNDATTHRRIRACAYRALHDAVLDRWSGEARQENAIGRADRPHDAVQVTAGTLVWSIKAKSLILWCARHDSNV